MPGSDRINIFWVIITSGLNISLIFSILILLSKAETVDIWWEQFKEILTEGPRTSNGTHECTSGMYGISMPQSKFIPFS